MLHLLVIQTKKNSILCFTVYSKAPTRCLELAILSKDQKTKNWYRYTLLLCLLKGTEAVVRISHTLAGQKTKN